jgi:hypothetical protein
MVAHLEVEPPHVVGLFVQQRRAPAIEGRIEPEPALRRPLHLHLDVADQELVLEHATLEREAQQPSHGGARAIRGDHPVGHDAIRALRRRYRQQRAVAGLLETLHLLPPAHVDQAGPGRRLDAGMLEIVLLQIDESRPAMALFRQQVEGEHLPLVEKYLAVLPGDALVDQGLAESQPVHDFQAALGPADRPAAVGEIAFGVDDDAAMTLAGEIERGHQPHRPGPHDDDRMARRRSEVLVHRVAV